MNGKERRVYSQAVDKLDPLLSLMRQTFDPSFDTDPGLKRQYQKLLGEKLFPYLPPDIVAIDLGNGDGVNRLDDKYFRIPEEQRSYWTLSDVDDFGAMLAQQVGKPWEKRFVAAENAGDDIVDAVFEEVDPQITSPDTRLSQTPNTDQLYQALIEKQVENQDKHRKTITVNMLRVGLESLARYEGGPVDKIHAQFQRSIGTMMFNRLPSQVVSINFYQGNYVNRDYDSYYAVPEEQRLHWNLADIDNYAAALAKDVGEPWEPIWVNG